MDDVPAEAVEEFQYMMLKKMDGLISTMEKINANLEIIAMKEKKV
ncbi:MAG TPA: hypothetical protein VJ461_01710 [Candidatus Nanoarchaeia archaeon]|nr:hypothetical protein [Candidatus Nanoarchaeia archaeon]